MIARRRLQVSGDVHTILVPLLIKIAKMQEDVAEVKGPGLPILFLNQDNQKKSCRAVNELQEKVIGMAKQRSARMRLTR